MNSPTDELPSLKIVKTKPEFLRAPLSRPFPFLGSKLPPYLEKQVAEETEQELNLLYERFAIEKRKPSGGDTYAVRTRVASKYEQIKLQNGVKAELWQYSERILNLLRTPGLCSPPDNEATSRALMAFIDKLPLKYFPEVDPESAFYLGPPSCVEIRPTAVVGPNQYFALAQPELVMNYGHAFHTSVAPPPSRPGAPIEPVVERLLSINTTFFGAFVGGDKRFGHDIVYYLPENRFYFFDPVMDCYVPTSEDKVRLGLSLAIQRQACGLLVEQAQPILNKFLTEHILDHIIAKAKTLLSVERGFFGGPQAKARFIVENQTANTIASTVKSFIKSQVAVDETNVLTISECVAQLHSFCQERGESLPSYKEVKVIVQMKMREIYGKGVRNDLVLPDNRCVAGWKGLRIEKEPAICNYGDSVGSDHSTI